MKRLGARDSKYFAISGFHKRQSFPEFSPEISSKVRQKKISIGGRQAMELNFLTCRFWFALGAFVSLFMPWLFQSPLRGDGRTAKWRQEPYAFLVRPALLWNWTAI